MRIENVEQKYKELKEKGIKMFRGLETYSYRVDDVVYEDKEFLIQDSDGYLLRFND